MKDHIDKLANSVVEVSKSYAIWRELTDKNRKVDRELIINDYLDFFSTTTNSHFMFFIITSNRLYDRSRNVISIIKVIEKIENEVLKQKLKKQLTEKKEFIRKIKRVRDKVLAHSDIKLDSGILFKEVGITPDEMREFVYFIQQQIIVLLEYYKCNEFEDYLENYRIFEENSTEDVVRLFKALT